MKQELYEINKREYYLVALICFALMTIFHETSLDQTLITPFFNQMTSHWPWRDHFITEKIFHKGGVKLVIILTISILSYLAYALKSKSIINRKRKVISLLHIIISALLSVLIVAFMKKTNPIHCPWDLSHFDGKHSFVSLRDYFNFSLPSGHCFPGGHSSGGFAWMGLYFSHQLTTGERRYRLLIPGVALGLIFGVTQQMRGAHFFSHDLATFLVVWIVSGAVALFMAKFINLKQQKNKR